MNIEDILRSSLDSITNNFRDDELAFLALTSKIELPFRDRWAYILHKQLGDDYIVSREWHRTDLALLDKKQNPLALIELKAMCTCDPVVGKPGLNGYETAIKNDFNKAKALAHKVSCPDAEVWALLLATDPATEITDDYKDVVKYHNYMNDAIEDCNGSATVRTIADQAVKKSFNGRIAHSGTFNGGKAFGIDTAVLFWLIKENIKGKDSPLVQ